MDALIQLIVWLLGRLFGEQEKPANMSSPSRTSRSRPTGQRRPGGGARPMTLEEILAEVRQQSARKETDQTELSPYDIRLREKRQQLALKEADAKRASVEPARPAPVPLSKPLSESEPPTASPHPAPAPPPQPPPDEKFVPMRVVKPNLPPAKAEFVRKTGGAKGEYAPAPAPERAKINRLAATEAIQIAARPIPAQFQFLQTLRSALPADKLAALRQAVVLKEVFGPPRALRPRHTGRM